MIDANLSVMAAKRITAYFDSDLHRALRAKALETDYSVSERVNAVVRATLSEDADDFATARARENEPNLRFENVLKAMLAGG